MRKAPFLLLVVFLVVTATPSGVSADDAVRIFDDFESDTPGSFPTGWLDVGQVDPDSNAPDPSAIVVSTTDADGNPTQAVAITEALAPSQGIYQPLPVSRFVSIAVDVRVDQFSDGPGSVDADFAIDVTLSQLQGETDPVFTPSMGVFASSVTKSWWGFVVGTDSVFFEPDLATPVELGRWYRVELDLDTVHGVIRAQITDLADTVVVLRSVVVIPEWTKRDGLFDAVSFFDGELSSEDVANITVIDNISVATDQRRRR